MSSDAEGWGKAIPIGILAGVPTAIFLQAGFVETLRKRGEAVRPSRLGGLAPPGLGYAVVRDCVYWAATQKQVQTPRPTWAEELTCQVCVVGVPLVCDTLSVRVVDPKFTFPRTSWRASLATACPPVALLGRATWIPLYNWAYVVAQQQIGDETPAKEVAGLVAGSLAASFVAYPLFVVKTNMLLLQGDSTSPWDAIRLVGRALARTAGLEPGKPTNPAAVFASVFKGVRPHAIANIGPDVLCMAAARAIFALLFAATAAAPSSSSAGGVVGKKKADTTTTTTAR